MEKLLNRLPEYDITDIALNLLELLGEHMHYSSKKLLAYRALNVIIFTILSIFIIIPLFQTGNKKYVENIEALVTVIHPFFKYVLFIHNKPYIERLFVEKSMFNWNEDDFETNFIKADKKLHKSLRIVQLFLPICFYVIFSFMLRPLFAGDSHMFIVETWVVDSIVVNTVILALQYYLLALIIPVLVGYDCLYMALSIHIIVQLRRLNHRLNYLLSTYTSVETQEELAVLIRYHQLLIRTFLQLRNIFSSTLLFHYFITLASSCSEIYVFMANSEYNMEQIAIVIILFSQFGYYTFPAELIASEFSNVSKAIYTSKWYKFSAPLQKLLLLIMKKAQSNEGFSAGGIIPVNVDTFGSVVKKSFSFYAILKNLLNKE